MAELKTVALSKIDANPHRGLETYPWIEPKVEQLIRSIKDVGFWEGVIVREDGDRYQLAFGHHRVEAAKRVGLTKIPVIVRKLTDEDMLKFMGRENGEDYNSEFLIMLNSWEAACVFAVHEQPNFQDTDIAKILGWTRWESRRDNVTVNATARACAGAHKLIQAGQFSRDDFAGLTVGDARIVTEEVNSRIKQIKASAKANQHTREQIKESEKHVVKGAKVTIEAVKEGKLAKKDVKASVMVEGFKSAQTSKRDPSPLFAVYGNSLAKQIDKMLRTDSAANKLGTIQKAVNQITLHADAAALRKIEFSLKELSSEAANWQKRLTPSKSKVVSINRLLEQNDV